MEQILTWAAPAATIIAAFITAGNFGTRITGVGFIVFTVGSLAWLALGALQHQPNLLWQNVVLTALNLFGIWRWLGRQKGIEEGAEDAARKSAATPGETLFPVSLLTRAQIVDRAGEPLGRAVEAMAGCRSGRLVYAVMTSGGVGGVGETFRRIEWNNLRAEGDRLSAGLDRRGVEGLPQLERERWPGR